MLIKDCHWDFPSGALAKTLAPNTGALGSIPDSGTQIPHVATKSLQATTNILPGVQRLRILPCGN